MLPENIFFRGKGNVHQISCPEAVGRNTESLNLVQLGVRRELLGKTDGIDVI